jgi:hypothetical protein
MKKLLVVLLALTVISGFAFAESDGRLAFSVNLAGKLISDSNNNTGYFEQDNKGQQDADLVTVSYNQDGKAGANFRLYDNSQDGSAVMGRKLSLWFKPIDSLKLSMGSSIQSGLYTEQLNWWHVANVSPTGGWSSDANFGGGQAFALQVTAVPNLTVDLGIAPGAANYFLNYYDGAFVANGNTSFGIVAKYKLEGFGSFGAAYRNDGNGGDGTQYYRAGAEVTLVPGLYAFETVIGRIDNSAFTGVAFDTYGKYTTGAFYAALYAPVTILSATTAHSYMSFDLKTGYKLADNFTPYLRLRMDGDESSGRIVFDNFVFSPSICLGADYSFGPVSLNTYLSYTLSNGAYEQFSIPFTARISF